MVTVADAGQPDLTGDDAPDAYVIPFQNGNTFYAFAEDMSALQFYVASGGLVVLLDAASGEGAAARDFVSQALNLQGDWYLCRRSAKPKMASKRFALSRHGDGLVLSPWAQSFLRDPGPESEQPATSQPNPNPDPESDPEPNSASVDGAKADSRGGGSSSAHAWPAGVEDARQVTTHTLCVHQDPALVPRPLYTVKGNEMQVAAQAFGRVGSPGAVVWLGYSWRDGPQEQWGGLLLKMVTDWARGAYRAPTEADEAWEPQDQDLGEEVVEEVFAAAAGSGLTDTLRLLLERPGVYPPPPSPGSGTDGNGNGNGNRNGNGSGNNGNGNNGNDNNGNGNNGNGNGNGGSGNGNGEGRRRRVTTEISQSVRRLLDAANIAPAAAA
ncbi:hypothetical protein PLESTF_001946100 [Pleodorina starrii]|nr:hypothetical protein PLESTF_001946100 [Pleodorina starrii]